MTVDHAPDHSTLEYCREEAFRLLARGVADRRSPFHTPTLASVTGAGEPDARTVVLRAFDPPGRALRLHTDLRSPKVAQLRGRPSALVHVYDPGNRVQLRLRGAVSLHDGDELAAVAWRDSRPSSRTCYAAPLAPGAPVPAPPAAPDDTEGGRANFLVLRFVFTEFDYLSLAISGHRRARFVWTGAALQAGWLAP